MRERHASRQRISSFIIFTTVVTVAGCIADEPADDAGRDSGAAADAGVDAVVTPCGNGYVDPDEECDDGNDVSGDGCEADCTFTCTADADCDTGDACRRFECRVDNTCSPPSVLIDGTECDADMDPSTRDLCVDGVCSGSICGDGVLDVSSGEECDDSNAVADDGCEADCTFSCTTLADCDTAEPCTTSFCGGGHVCTPPAPSSGELCDADGDPDSRDICVSGTCQLSACGDGVLDMDAGEICDDGDSVSGNGCEDDCTWSCTTHAECDDGDPCNGMERCNFTTHACTPSGVLSLC